MFTPFYSIHKRDGQTDRQTDGWTDRHCAVAQAALCIASRGKNGDSPLIRRVTKPTSKFERLLFRVMVKIMDKIRTSYI